MHPLYTASHDLSRVVQAADQLGTFAALVAESGLDDRLREGGPFTIFVPTDEAFARLGDGTLERLRASTDEARSIVLGHLVTRLLESDRPESFGLVTTAFGGVVACDLARAKRVGPARLVRWDVPASNGVLHVIDDLLWVPAFERAPGEEIGAIARLSPSPGPCWQARREGPRGRPVAIGGERPGDETV